MATLHVNNGGTWQAIADGDEFKVNDSGTWKQAKEVWANNGGTWVKVWQDVAPMSLSANPVSMVDLVFPGQTAEDSVTVSVSGGTPPYTYAWSIVSQQGNAYFSDNVGPTATLRDYFSIQGENTGYVRCTVTDANNNTEIIDISFFFSAENQK